MPTPEQTSPQDGQPQFRPNIYPPSNNQEFTEIVDNVLMMRSELINKFFDRRRDLNFECGYPQPNDRLDPQRLRTLFDEEPVANRAVQVLPKESWKGTPIVYEDDDPDKITRFERAWNDLGKSLYSNPSWSRDEKGSSVWEYLRRADIMSGIGHFGIILLGLDDGLPLSEPVSSVVTMNDGYLLPSEQDTLNNLPNLNDSERSTINQLVHNREVVINKISNPSRMLEGTDRFYYNYPGMGQGVGGSITDQYTGVRIGSSDLFREYDDETKPQPSPQGPTDPSKPLRKLLFMRVFDESLVQIVRYEWNILNPRFGMPVLYRVTLNDPKAGQSGIGLPTATVFVHWSRVVHLADNLNSSEIHGTPRMRPVLNSILDIQKVRGGSAEMYWRGAFPGLAISTHPQVGANVRINTDDLKQMMEDYANGLQRYLALIGMSVNTLAPQVVDPTPQIDAQIDAVCIQLGIPVRIFKGSERGELASTQDDAEWRERLRDRQLNYISPRVITPFIDRLINIGVLPKPKDGYSIEWPDIGTMTDQEKANVSYTRTQALAMYINSQGERLIPLKYFLNRFMFINEIEASLLVEAARKQPESDILTPDPDEGVEVPGSPEKTAKKKGGNSPNPGRPGKESPKK